jgi:nicotinamidase-related amidase
LLLIDLQKAVDDPSWGPRNNADAERTIARLLQEWRTRKLPLIHVRHDSSEAGSTYRPGQVGHEFKPEAAPLEGEVVVAKRTNSAFIGTDLEGRLRAAGCRALVVVGVSTSNCVEATVRMAGNLGFETFLVEDGCFTFDRTDWSGRRRTATEVHDMSLANLSGEYCAVVTAEWVCAELGALPAPAGAGAADCDAPLTPVE